MYIEDLAREVSARCGYVHRDCLQIIRETFKVIGDELEGHGSVSIHNFGKFDVYERKARKYAKPDTGEDIFKEAKMYPRFQYFSDIKDRVL